MGQRDDWAWTPDNVMHEPVYRDFRRLDSLRHIAVLVAAAVVLLGTGAGLTLALTGAGSSSPSAKAGLYSISPPGGAISAAMTRRLATRVDPAVVDINAVIETPSGAADVAGTGMIISPTGEIVTNNHVVENAKTIRVTVPTMHERLVATFVGADPGDDIALVEITGPRPFPAVRFGSSSRVQVGESVLAFGNSLGLGGVASVTAGTVSALNRSITATSETGADAEHLNGMIETDAPIAPGNSGGPLVNGGGFVVGMNTAAATSSNAAGTPVAFALPINRIVAIVHKIERRIHGGGIVVGRTAYLGIEGATIRLAATSPRGAVNIVQVEPGTPAASAGLEPGDVITAFDGGQATSMRRLSVLIARLRPGSRVAITYEAGGLRHVVHVTLVPGPAA
jgi:S1-C subfamily serine protease